MERGSGLYLAGVLAATDQAEARAMGCRCPSCVGDYRAWQEFYEAELERVAPPDHEAWEWAEECCEYCGA